ncbi:ABC transporter permease [Streptosporangium sp. NPDC051022]|uniref:ABC transporter permease n=1 Tax=Streptosporangium sp. NPDC051022 TaxID=3155752 RepID=UPI00343441DA
MSQTTSPPAPTPETAARPESRPRRGRRAAARAEAAALPLAWAAICVVFALLRPDTFATMDNVSSILGSQAVLVVLAFGLLIPLRCGDFDLSVAGTLTLSTMVVAVLNGQQGWPLPAAIAVALLTGALVGLVNGVFVLYFGINSFIVTLAVGQVLLGLVSMISDNRIVSGVDQALLDAVVLNRLFGIPLEFYYALLLAVVLWFVFDHTALGRRLLFVGAGREVARLSGTNVARVRLGALVAAGVIAALAGVLYAGTTGSADPRGGTAYLLPAFAAAFLGATSITPGRFNPWGTIIAAYFLLTGITGLQMLGAQTYVQDLFYGGALVLAVALSQLLRGRRPQQFT